MKEEPPSEGAGEGRGRGRGEAVAAASMGPELCVFFGEEKESQRWGAAARGGFGLPVPDEWPRPEMADCVRPGAALGIGEPWRGLGGLGGRRGLLGGGWPGPATSVRRQGLGCGELSVKEGEIVKRRNNVC